MIAHKSCQLIFLIEVSVLTSYELYCNFISAKRKADELDNIAEELRTEANRSFSDSLSSLSSCWTGEGADIYRDKGYMLRDELISSAKNLNKAAETIRVVSERIYKSEMRAIQIAKERKYK